MRRNDFWREEREWQTDLGQTDKPRNQLCTVHYYSGMAKQATFVLSRHVSGGKCLHTEISCPSLLLDNRSTKEDFLLLYYSRVPFQEEKRDCGAIIKSRQWKMGGKRSFSRWGRVFSDNSKEECRKIKVCEEWQAVGYKPIYLRISFMFLLRSMAVISLTHPPSLSAVVENMPIKFMRREGTDWLVRFSYYYYWLAEEEREPFGRDRFVMANEEQQVGSLGSPKVCWRRMKKLTDWLTCSWWVEREERERGGTGPKNPSPQKPAPAPIVKASAH